MSLAIDAALVVLGKGSVLLMLTALASVLWRRSSAAGRHLLWALALLGLFLLPFGERLMPHVRAGGGAAVAGRGPECRVGEAQDDARCVRRGELREGAPQARVRRAGLPRATQPEQPSQVQALRRRNVLDAPLPRGAQLQACAVVRRYEVRRSVAQRVHGEARGSARAPGPSPARARWRRP